MRAHIAPLHTRVCKTQRGARRHSTGALLLPQHRLHGSPRGALENPKAYSFITSCSLRLEGLETRENDIARLVDSSKIAGEN